SPSALGAPLHIVTKPAAAPTRFAAPAAAPGVRARGRHSPPSPIRKIFPSPFNYFRRLRRSSRGRLGRLVQRLLQAAARLLTHPFSRPDERRSNAMTKHLLSAALLAALALPLAGPAAQAHHAFS